MTYKVTKGKIERESLAFGGGCIASTGSGSYEVRYWLRDHLGSVRVVRTASGRIVEENAYYPFGLRQRRQDYAVSCNRYRYNGKEEQQTFGYLDYGFRMYDACLGRWHSSDPLSERDPGISGYAYVKNAPLRYRDILGLTYTGYGDVPPYKYRWTPDGYELEEVVVTAPRGGSGYAFPILGAMGYSRQSGALWRTVFTWERYFESASDLRSVYGNASPNVSYDAPGPHFLHPDSHASSHSNPAEFDGQINYIINMQRIAESSNATVSEFIAYGPIPLKPVIGYFLEPGGPSTTIANRDKRIPSGIYLVAPYSSKKYSNHYIISNNSVSRDRYILIHSGNYHSHTLGCLLPGSSYSMVNGDYAVWNSSTTLNSLRLLFDGNSGIIVIYDINTNFIYYF